LAKCCYYIDPSMVNNGHYEPVFVRRDVPGFNPTGYNYGTDFAHAKKLVDDLNTNLLGITPEQAEEIVGSSIRAQLRLQQHPDDADDNLDE
jgi:hypothetical protein